MSRKLTTEEFIEKAKKVHGDKYDYSKVDYINNVSKIKIICPIHGEFMQRPHDHLNGKGCSMCKNEKIKTMKTLSVNDFLMNAKAVHGDEYDYSKAEYVNTHIKICIICPIHGEFWMTPHNHVTGRQGCPKCKNKKISHSKTMTQIAFIEKAKKVHGDKYDYSKVDYINGRTKVSIICPIHGEFMQLASNHLYGLGCPYCKESKLERKMQAFLLESSIKFERQKRFRWLGKQSIDFYLLDYNIGIECQGRQHFESVMAFGGNDGHDVTVGRDNKKLQKCLENRVQLVYYIEERFKHYINNGLIYTKDNTFTNLEELFQKIQQLTI